MKTTTTGTAALLDIATDFVRDIATQFNMPELLAADHVLDGGSGMVKIAATLSPQGQAAAMCKTLEATLYVMPHDIEGLAYAKLSLSYTHHSGGSNGVDRCFIITLAERRGVMVYDGWMDERTFFAAHRAVNRASAK